MTPADKSQQPRALVDHAKIDFGDGAATTLPRSAQYDDIYHPAAGAMAQARNVFLLGNGLPQRWRDRRRFTVLETGFGLGNNFLATWAAWAACAGDGARCEQLVFISVELHPPSLADVRRVHRDPALRAFADELTAAWPPATANLHLIDFAGGAVRLLLGFGDVRKWLPQLVAQVDAFYLDGFLPARNPAMWEPRVIRGLARLAAPEATLATWTAAQALRASLAACGFVAQLAPGANGKREITLARFAPAFLPRRHAPRGAAVFGSKRHAVIIGAGIAGACAASALARLGWRCTVLEAQPAPASGASGNPAGLFHGGVQGAEAPHARFNRAAALLAHRRYSALISSGHVAGSVAGLMQVGIDSKAGDIAADYASPVGGSDADSGVCSESFAGTTWQHHRAGWVDPVALVQTLLEHERIELRCNAAAHRLRRDGDAWLVVDSAGRVLAQAPVVVLATAGASAALLDELGVAPTPSRQSRGQLSWLDKCPTALAQPVTGHGYALPLPDGRLLFGASAHDDDFETGLRETDHARNLERLQGLTGITPEPGASLHGRVGWRHTTDDRLPIVGAVPLRPSTTAFAGDQRPRLDHCRFVPRLAGLYLLEGLASRGLTWAPLAGEVLAAWIDGAPMPIEADLLDAVDPARWQVRAVRRGSAADQAAGPATAVDAAADETAAEADNDADDDAVADPVSR